MINTTSIVFIVWVWAGVDVLIVEALPAVRAVFIVAFGAPGAVIEVFVLPADNVVLTAIVVFEPDEVMLTL